MNRKPLLQDAESRYAITLGYIGTNLRHLFMAVGEELRAAGFRRPEDLYPPKRHNVLGERVQGSRGLAEQETHFAWSERKARIDEKVWNLFIRKLLRLNGPPYTASLVLLGLLPIEDFPRAYRKAGDGIRAAFGLERPSLRPRKTISDYM